MKAFKDGVGAHWKCVKVNARTIVHAKRSSIDSSHAHNAAPLNLNLEKQQCMHITLCDSCSILLARPL